MQVTWYVLFRSFSIMANPESVYLKETRNTLYKVHLALLIIWREKMERKVGALEEKGTKETGK